MKRNKDKDVSRLREVVNILIKNDLIKGLTPEKLRLIIEDLGPTFVKFGQILSLRSDLIPQEFCNELVKLHSDVKPMAYEEVKVIIEEALGKDLSDLFSYFDIKPLGSASIAQVHKARLHTGQDIVVKVQRSGVKHVMERDIKLLKKATGLLKITPGVNDVIDFNTVLEELWVTTQEELNFVMEASRLEVFDNLNKEVKYVACPRIYREYSHERVFVMEYIDGIPVNDRDGLLNQGYDLNEIAQKLAANYSKQVMVDGVFHADPHPGNIMVRQGQIVWLDFGMMGTLSGHGRGLLLKFTEAVVNNDVNAIKEVILTIGKCEDKIDHTSLYADIDDILVRYGSVDFGGLDIAKYLNEVLEVALRHRIQVPSGYTMLGRGLTNLEGVIEMLSPEINYLEIAQGHMFEEKTGDLKVKLTGLLSGLSNSFNRLLETPKLINGILSMVMKGQTKIGMELQSSQDFERLLMKVVNNLVMGLIVSALLVGSSLIATTEMKPQVLDIPLLGALGYMIAFVISIGLLIDFRKTRKK